MKYLSSDHVTVEQYDYFSSSVEGFTAHTMTEWQRELYCDRIWEMLDCSKTVLYNGVQLVCQSLY